MKLSNIAMKARPSSTLSLSAETNRKKASGIDIINFSAGEPDFDTPEHIKAAAIKAIQDNFTKYTPYEGITELRQAIAESLKNECGIDYDYDQIVVSNGSKHAIKNALTAILDIGDEVLLPAPYWNSYIDIINMCYGVPVIVNTSIEYGFKVSKKMLAEKLTDKTKAIIINSPNNPTGMVYSREELEEIAEFAVENDLFVISDELYRKLVYSRKLQHTSIASLNNAIKERTIVVDGLSKSYAMTGWRVGYTASSKEVAKAIANIQSNSTSNINSVAQMAALEAFRADQTCVSEMLKEFEHRRDYISQRISDIPFLSSLLPKGAFYLFVDVSKLFGNSVSDIVINNSNDVAEILLNKYNVAVVPSSAFGYDNYIRISYATAMRDIVEGVNRIEKFIKENF